MKTCKKCKIPKELEEFCNRKGEKDGKCRYCKECRNKASKNYYSENKEAHNARSAKWVKENKEVHSKMVNDHYHNNKDYYRNWNRLKMKSDPLFRLRHAISALITIHLKNKGGKSKRSLEYLGCDIEFYRNYLETQFTTEMTWENYGSYWEIDHKISINKGGSFHYSNTQPMIVRDNRIKSNKY